MANEDESAGHGIVAIPLTRVFFDGSRDLQSPWLLALPYTVHEVTNRISLCARGVREPEHRNLFILSLTVFCLTQNRESASPNF
jgi:3-deoxy-D-arabino-heptulosonate 7-phosphate (DAHP) synthase